MTTLFEPDVDLVALEAEVADLREKVRAAELEADHAERCLQFASLGGHGDRAVALMRRLLDDMVAARRAEMRQALDDARTAVGLPVREERHDLPPVDDEVSLGPDLAFRPVDDVHDEFWREEQETKHFDPWGFPIDVLLALVSFIIVLTLVLILF